MSTRKAEEATVRYCERHECYVTWENYAMHRACAFAGVVTTWERVR